MRAWQGRRRPGRVLAVVVTVLALGLGAASGIEAQTRGATQRSTVAPPQNDRANARQGRVLLDRFAQRAGRALRLSPDQTRRLQNELQASREARSRITAQARVVRQELARMVRESSTDETRMAELLDESVQLEIRAAEVGADEQRRLAEFLTPTQRVRIIWLRQRLAQEALRQRDTLPADPPPGVN
ncbi:MAG: hypothetical protein OEU54_04375 [Gemmatimonadota bacterium]|nr:hypothetical protein [Gemmatimonadota bacterium]